MIQECISSIWLFWIVGSLPCGAGEGPACHPCLTMLCNFVFLEKKFRIFWTASMPALKSSKQCCQGSSTTSVPKRSATWVSSHCFWFLRNTAQVAPWDVPSFFYVVMGKRREHLEKQIVTNRMSCRYSQCTGLHWEPFPDHTGFLFYRTEGRKKWKKFASHLLLKPDHIPSHPDCVFDSTGWYGWYGVKFSCIPRITGK